MGAPRDLHPFPTSAIADLIQEGHQPLLSPVPGLPGQAPRDEAHMPAPLGDFQGGRRAELGGAGKGAGEHEGVVAGMEDQGGGRNPRQELAAATAVVIVVGPGEAMERGSDLVVEGEEAPEP